MRPTSFLRLAGVPFVGQDADGATAVPAAGRARPGRPTWARVTPHLGGGSFRYDPLPAKLVSRRRRLRLVYHDGSGLQALSLGEAKALAPAP